MGKVRKAGRLDPLRQRTQAGTDRSRGAQQADRRTSTTEHRKECL